MRWQDRQRSGLGSMVRRLSSEGQEQITDPNVYGFPGDNESRSERIDTMRRALLLGGVAFATANAFDALFGPASAQKRKGEPRIRVEETPYERGASSIADLTEEALRRDLHRYAIDLTALPNLQNPLQVQNLLSLASSHRAIGRPFIPPFAASIQRPELAFPYDGLRSYYDVQTNDDGDVVSWEFKSPVFRMRVNSRRKPGTEVVFNAIKTGTNAFLIPAWAQMNIYPESDLHYQQARASIERGQYMIPWNLPLKPHHAELPTLDSIQGKQESKNPFVLGIGETSDGKEWNMLPDRKSYVVTGPLVSMTSVVAQLLTETLDYSGFDAEMRAFYLSLAKSGKRIMIADPNEGQTLARKAIRSQQGLGELVIDENGKPRGFIVGAIALTGKIEKGNIGHAQTYPWVYFVDEMQ